MREPISIRLRTFLIGAGLIFELEMRQRLRGVAWYVLLGVFFLILAIVTVVTSIIVYGYSSGNSGVTAAEVGGPAFSLIIYFVLLLGTLVAPAMSGNAINGDRDAGTLATTQVTLVTTWQIVFGKFLAAWVTALGFLLVATPFLVYAGITGEVNPARTIVAIVVLGLELGVVAAIGVGLSGLITRPLFSVVVTYLAVAALTIGTLLVFTLGGLAVQAHVVSYSYDRVNYKQKTCSGLESYDSIQPRFDLVWGALAANPYVLVAEAVPSQHNRNDGSDLFSDIKIGLLEAQTSGAAQTPQSECQAELGVQTLDGNSAYAKWHAVLSWVVGLLVQFVLAGFALWGAYVKTRTPAGRLSTGSRVA